MDKSLQLKIVARLQDQLSAPLRKIRGVSGDAGTGIKALRDELRTLQTSQKQIGEFRELKQGLAATRTALGQAQDRVQQLSREMAATATPTAQMRREFDAAVRTARNLSLQHDQQREKLHHVRSALSDAGISTRNLSQAEIKLRADISSTNQKLDEQKDRLARVAEQTRKLAEAREKMERTQALAGRAAASGAASAAVGYGILRGGAGLLGEGIEFDETMSRVQALTRLDGASKELAALREQARELGASTMFSATEAASGQAFLAMAGFTPQAIRDAMPGMLDVAKAGGLELAQAADVASNILTGFGLNASDMGRVGDVLTGAFTRSNTSLQMLGETMKYVGPNAAAYGQDIEIMAAAAGKLGDAGIQGSMAGTALRAILSRLAAPPKAAAEALDELGIKVEDAQGNMRPFPDLLTEIYEKTKDLGNATRGGLLKDIAGEEAGSALTVLVGQAGTGALQDLIQTLREAEGEAAKTAKTMGNNLTGDLDELSSAWSDIKITLLDVTRGPLRELTQMLTEVTTKVGAWAQRNPELVATLAKLLAIIGVLAAAFGGIAMSVAAVLGPFAMARYAVTALSLSGGGLGTTLVGLAKTAIPAVGTAVATVGKVLLANPIMLLAAGIAAAAVAIYANWDTLGPMFQRLWDAISERAAQAWAAITGFFSSAWSEISAGFSGGIASIGATILNWSPVGLFYQVFSEVLSYLGVELPGRFTEFGSMIMQGLINGIKGMVGGVKDAVVGVADSTVGWFKEKLGIQSPSRIFIGMGENISEGAAIGIERGRSLAEKASGGLAALMAAAGMAGQPALSMPALTFDTRAPLGAMQGFGAAMGSMGAAAGGGVTVQGDTINITIQVGPDQQPQDIARAISAELDRRERQKAARTRSSLSDYGL